MVFLGRRKKKTMTMIKTTRDMAKDVAKIEDETGKQVKSMVWGKDAIQSIEFYEDDMSSIKFRRG